MMDKVQIRVFAAQWTKSPLLQSDSLEARILTNKKPKSRDGKITARIPKTDVP
jgi:hypothetical protein